MASSKTTPAKKRPATRAQRMARRQRRRRILGTLVLALGLGAAWVWQRTLPLRAIDVTDTVNADPAEVARLTGAEPDSVALFRLGPALMADRAQRHPWVRRAYVRRLPTGTLRIRVEERTPAALVLDASGAPHHFLDAGGYAMPVVPRALADVPLLTGAPAYHPTQPVQDAGLRELLAALAAAPPETNALVDAVAWGRRPSLTTAPVGDHDAVAVRLPRTGHAGALRRLRAFWDQTVLPQPDAAFALVDLRFDGQIVTRESAPVRTVSTAASAPSSDAARPAEAGREATQSPSSPRTATAAAAGGASTD